MSSMLGADNILVSIHAPARGATSSISRSADAGNVFQSTRPRGARPVLSLMRGISFAVSIHAPARGATEHLVHRRDIWGVSIHAPARGATSGRDARYGCSSGFNPRAREGRDSAVATSTFARPSFNPRAREGRDSCRHPAHQVGRVSIHAPARGATYFNDSTVILTKSFNPRAREGRDSLLPHIGTTGRLVSIHAPARGATKCRRCWGQTTFSFQSTRPRGARHPQSHAPRMPATCFNPRAREGRDRSCLSCGAFHLPFQSTRPRGARRSTLYTAETFGAFQSTRPRGARHRVGMQDMGALRVSIHAPARGATRGWYPRHSSGHGFNPRAREGRDTLVARVGKVDTTVSIHAPARGATARC